MTTMREGTMREVNKKKMRKYVKKKKRTMSQNLDLSEFGSRNK